MKKTYINPATTIAEIAIEHNILAGSGVQNGSTVGKEYNESDITFSRSNSVWGDDEEEE